VIPAYNESFRIERSLRHVLGYLAAQEFDSEVLLVDDGSTDGTAAIARNVASIDPTLFVISLPHRGKAAAVREGLSHAKGDLVLFTDADLATPIEYLGRFRREAIGGSDVVIGSREGAEAARIGEPWFRHLMGRGFNTIVRCLLLPGIHDTQCGFKLFTREATCQILSRSRLYLDPPDELDSAKVTAFDVELLVIARRLGYRVAVVPVTWTFGDGSKVDPVSDTLTNLEDVLAVKWNDLRGRYD
jgi:glycosyltransferase involved in cell wall biosynthesis